MDWKIGNSMITMTGKPLRTTLVCWNWTDQFSSPNPFTQSVCRQGQVISRTPGPLWLAGEPSISVARRPMFSRRSTSGSGAISSALPTTVGWTGRSRILCSVLEIPTVMLARETPEGHWTVWISGQASGSCAASSHGAPDVQSQVRTVVKLIFRDEHRCGSMSWIHPAHRLEPSFYVTNHKLLCSWGHEFTAYLMVTF